MARRVYRTPASVRRCRATASARTGRRRRTPPAQRQRGADDRQSCCLRADRAFLTKSSRSCGRAPARSVPTYAGSGARQAHRRAWYTYERHVEHVTGLSARSTCRRHPGGAGRGGPIGCAGRSRTPTGWVGPWSSTRGLSTGRRRRDFMSWRGFAQRNPDLSRASRRVAATTDCRRSGRAARRGCRSAPCRGCRSRARSAFPDRPPRGETGRRRCCRVRRTPVGQARAGGVRRPTRLAFQRWRPAARCPAREQPVPPGRSQHRHGRQQAR